MSIRDLIAGADFIYKIRTHLKKPIGIFYSFLLASCTIYFTYDSLIKYSNINATYEIIFIASIYLLFFFIWLLYSSWTPIVNQVFHSKKLVIGIAYVNIESDNLKAVKEFCNTIISDLKSRNGLYCCEFYLIEKDYATIDAVKKDVESKNTETENVIVLEIAIGNVEGQKTFMITNGEMIYRGFNQLIFNDGILELNTDISLVSQNKVLNYTEANSLFGKKAVQKNIIEIIIYFIGTFLLCNRMFKESISTFNELFKPGDNLIVAKIEPSTKSVRIVLNQEKIVQARIAYLFEKLYREIANNYYSSGLKEQAIENLKLLEKTIGHCPLLYWDYILMARIFYQMDEPNSAREYTMKARSLFSKDTLEISLNKGFFAILDNDPKSLYNNYKNITENTVISMVDVVAFLEEESIKFLDKKLLFQYAIAYLNFWYCDFRVGVESFENFIKESNNIKELKILRNSAKNILLKKKKREKEVSTLA